MGQNQTALVVIDRTHQTQGGLAVSSPFIPETWALDSPWRHDRHRTAHEHSTVRTGAPAIGNRRWEEAARCRQIGRVLA